MSNLRKLIQAYFWANHISLREFQKETGINFTALSRFVNAGRPLSQENLIKLWTWLFVDRPSGREGKE